LASVYINSAEKEPLNFQQSNFPGFFTAAGEVERTDGLSGVVTEIESMGLAVRSAVAIVEKLESETGKAKLAIGALALLILMVAALGISNTMIIAVIERTPEFGIMKSLGASDGQVLWLLLLEGLLTGILGAAIALVISMAAAPLASELCRHYIEARLKSSFDQSVFSFAVTDFLIVFLLSGFVCTFASLLPAWRAAKLDPVVAMKK
jgi:putative ABC transport system permease protein